MRDDLGALAAGVRAAQRKLGSAAGDVRTSVLRRLSELLAERRQAILEANHRDMEAARKTDLADPLIRRLELGDSKIDVLREGVDRLAADPDPVGRVLRRTELDDGLILRQVHSPLGVLLIMFESRPDAVVQIGALAIRSGNGVLLKGGSEALHSNRALVACLRDALAEVGMPADAVQGIEGREAIRRLLELDEHIDLVIPRGSGELVRSIQSSTRIPVLGHAEGVCHLYVDESADPAMAARLAVDGKCDYPSACNATETLLLHQGFLDRAGEVARALADAGVEIRADDRSRPHFPGSMEATESDWPSEYGDLTLAVRTVASLDEAIDHIHRHGSLHTDAIVTEDPAAAERFLREVDAASVFVNASTRFADGYRYGLGAEVGISTSRIHARGPVGVDGLLTTRWLLEGGGHVAGDYGPGKRAFKHRPLQFG